MRKAGYIRRMQKEWNFTPIDSELRAKLVKGLNILPVTAQLLINRGLVDIDKALSFLSPKLEDLHDPFLMKDMDKAVERLSTAIMDGETIAIYGDYDVDGTTSTALLCLFLEEVGAAHIIPYIPERMSEGYGLNKTAMETLAGKGVSLIVTVDCGSSNGAEVARAKELGMDVIVTDHHEVGTDKPLPHAFLNPRQSDCGYPFKGLAGVGVAFKLVMALRAHLRDDGHFIDDVPNIKKYLDIVAIGTVADMVPLVDENRVLAGFGLKVLSATIRIGLKALMEITLQSGWSGGVTSDNIAFQIAPRINAAGRVERADTALKLITTTDTKEARELALRLDMENSSRQVIERKILEEALAMVEERLKDGVYEKKVIVLSAKGWHSGVIGIVASRLVERYARPTLLIAIDADGVGKGSARSVRGVDILTGIAAASEHLVRFGGHKAAAGLTVDEAEVEAFKSDYIEYMERNVSDEDLIPKINIECEVSFDELQMDMILELEKLAPFGMGNAKPMLAVSDAEVMSTKVVAKKHLRLTLGKGGVVKDAIAFGKSDMHPLSGKGFIVAFSPYLDRWNGREKVGIRVKEIKALSEDLKGQVSVKI